MPHPSQYFDQTQNDARHNNFFENFTPPWGFFLRQGRHSAAEQLWISAFKITKDWELEKSVRIHKGTLYYFWGVTCILAGDLDKGFLLMHGALEEDKITSSTEVLRKPAFMFVSLDDSKADQFFRPYVLKISQFVNQHLDEYCNTRGGKISLDHIRRTFLRDDDFIEILFHFVYAMSCLERLIEEIQTYSVESAFSAILYTNKLFNI